MDAVTTANLKQFANAHGVSHLPDDKAFEYLSAYCALSSVIEDTLDLDQVVMGGGADAGSDSIAIIVNGLHVTDPTQVDDILNNNKFLDVQFIFVQSTVSSSFDSGKVHKFLFGIEDFFAEVPSLSSSPSLDNVRQIKDEIFRRAAAFKRGNPDVYCYYVSTGSWQDPSDVNAIIQAARSRLHATNMLENVTIEMVDARKLQQLYRSTQNSLSAELTIPNVITLPPIEGIDQSFLGYLSAREYLKLITDEHGNIRKTVFYDNVRDFQGDNKVNSKISDTLESDRRAEFIIRNNGITVVAKDLTRTGNVFTLTDYQVVNGCQTSHVLFANASKLDESVSVPVKIISTTSEDATKGIIEATNSQTEVSDEQLKSLSEFQRLLEDHYATFADEQRLYYERRSKQYAGMTEIEKTRVVSIPQQIKTFAAMFLDDPHRAGRYYATLRKLHEDKLFKQSDKADPYYTAAYSAYRLEYLFRNNLLAVEFKAIRYHLLMMARILIAEQAAVPAFNSRHVQTLCKKIDAIMWSSEKSVDVFLAAAGLAEETFVNEGWLMDRDQARREDTTVALKKAAEDLASS